MVPIKDKNLDMVLLKLATLKIAHTICLISVDNSLARSSYLMCKYILSCMLNLTLCPVTSYSHDSTRAKLSEEKTDVGGKLNMMGSHGIYVYVFSFFFSLVFSFYPC